AHFRNVNHDGRFSWWEEGESQLEFDPLFPSRREGSRADEAVPTLLAAGFEVDDRPNRRLNGTLAATFALAERHHGCRGHSRFTSDN
ncbi:MAG TPA: DUF6461 domain-containing protein, partial [Acidimicrobiales bacterium]|nr:DUF6461 domain-containing protein [Acidimicrobiales bacterium]